MATKAQKQMSLVQSYQKVFSTPEGQKVLSDLVSTHGVLNSCFRKDYGEMAFADGERNVVLRIIKLLDLDVEKLRERMREYDSE